MKFSTTSIKVAFGGLCKLFILIFCILVLPNSTKAAGLAETESTGLQAQGKIYVVVGVLAIIWCGIGLYLFLLERRIARIEKVDRLATPERSVGQASKPVQID